MKRDSNFLPLNLSILEDLPQSGGMGKTQEE